MADDFCTYSNNQPGLDIDELLLAFDKIKMPEKRLFIVSMQIGKVIYDCVVKQYSPNSIWNRPEITNYGFKYHNMYVIVNRYLDINGMFELLGKIRDRMFDAIEAWDRRV